MKKLLLSAMALVAAMSVSAQTEMGVIDAEALGLSSDAITVPAGTKLIETESVVCTLTDLNDQECKATGLSKNDVKVNGADFGSTTGIQGNTNGPGTAASTGEFPTQGCIYHFVPNKDGFLYVIHKASANKNYVVFEEKTRIPYIFASESGGYDLNTIEGATVTNEEGITTIAPEYAILQARMIIDNDPASESSNGAGTCAIKFPVYEGLAYDVLATGSKMTMAGFIFDTTGDATIVCAREDSDITLLENGQLPESLAYEAEVWTIAGSGTMMGSSWDTADTTNDMGTTDGKIYTLSLMNVVLEKGVTYEYKVAKDHAWTEAYPSSNATLTVEETGTYTIIFTFNSETKELTAKAEKTGEATIGEKTYSVIGTINGNWDNDTYMDGANGLYMAMFPNVKAGTYEFKVRVDGKWDEAYPSSNYKLELEKDANVAVLFNSETKEVSVEIVKTTIGAEDNTTAYLGDHSMLIPLSELGGGCNIKFTNYSSKANNWNNWVAVITNNYAEPFAEGAIKIALRADNWENIQWSNEGVTSNFNWDTFKDDMDGSTVEMTVDRAVNGDVKIHADITTAAGTKYFEEFTKNLGTEEPLYFCLSVDGSHLELLPVDDPTAIQSAKAQAKAGIRYNLAGQKVDANYKGIVIENGKKFMVK